MNKEQVLIQLLSAKSNMALFTLIQKALDEIYPLFPEQEKQVETLVNQLADLHGEHIAELRNEHFRLEKLEQESVTKREEVQEDGLTIHRGVTMLTRLDGSRSVYYEMGGGVDVIFDTLD